MLAYLGAVACLMVIYQTAVWYMDRRKVKDLQTEADRKDNEDRIDREVQAYLDRQAWTRLK